jgi:leucine-rich repeat transmembrane neuronal protein 1/2
MLHTFIYFILFLVAVIGGFQGNEYITYYYTTTQETHTNDISLRFKSFLRNAFLFQTVSSSSTDYLRGELDNGRIKVTIKVEGQPPQVILCNWYLC